MISDRPSSVQPALAACRRGRLCSLLPPRRGARAPATAPPQAVPGGGGQTAVIDVNRARTDPIPIAIPALGGGDGNSAQLGQDIAAVVIATTWRAPGCSARSPSGVHPGRRPPGRRAEFPELEGDRRAGAGHRPGRGQGGGQVRVEFRLWDVLPQTQIQGTAYTTSQANWRRIAHIMADVIYERLLGEKGYFDTRIVYIAATGPRDRRTKRLAIMDQDSENNRFLTDGSWLVLTPRFHPTRDEIAFMSYANNRPRVYLFNLGSGRQRVLGDFAGMTFAPRFSPDGNSVVMAVATGGGSDIVSVDLGSHASRRLTNSGAIDVSPCYSPDGSQIVFNSDRGGDQQLYVMGAGGGGAKRISFGSGRYATPVWSPRGDLIAFTRFGGEIGNFSIGVMHPDGSGERILSEGFSGRRADLRAERPGADVLAADAGARQPGSGFSSRLVSVDITGFNERPVETPTDASDPAWSPLAA